MDRNVSYIHCERNLFEFKKLARTAASRVLEITRGMLEVLRCEDGMLKFMLSAVVHRPRFDKGLSSRLRPSREGWKQRRHPCVCLRCIDDITQRF
jgi:hypothetical protein